VFVTVILLQVLAFRYMNRDLFWVARTEAAAAPVGMTREAVLTALSRPKLSRRYAEAIIRVTDREGLRDLRLQTLTRLAEAHPDEAGVQLRYAEALRAEGRLDEAARVFARVAEAR
jgi:hypothetical protein